MTYATPLLIPYGKAPLHMRTDFTPTPDVHNNAMRADDQQGPTILGATLTVTVVALITTIARIFVRGKMIKNMGWDDYVMILTMLLCVVGQCIIVPQIHFGAGRHIEYIDPDDFRKGFKLNVVTQPIYLFAICFVKISVGFFLLRIAVQLYYRRIIIGIMVFMGIYTTACIFTIVLQCTDLRMLWDQSIRGGTCWTAHTLRSLSYVNQALNISTDIAFSIAIPIPMVWTIQMNRRQKALLICILGLGIFATAAALVKLAYLPNYGRTGDWLWDSRNLTIWTVVECNIGIIACNLPCLKPIFRTVLGSTYGCGSHEPTQPNYLSRPYGPGTSLRSAAKHYASLASNKSINAKFRGYNAAGETYMLTTIDANKEKAAEASNNLSGRILPGLEESSTESVMRLNGNKLSELGNIKVTTKVDVTESVHSREYYEEGERHDRLQTKDMV